MGHCRGSREANPTPLYPNILDPHSQWLAFTSGQFTETLSCTILTTQLISKQMTCQDEAFYLFRFRPLVN